MILKELRKFHRIQRIEYLTAELLALEERDRVGPPGDETGSGEEDLEQRRREVVEAVLEVAPEGVGVEGVAELEEDGAEGSEDGVDGAVIGGGGGGAEGGDEVGEEGGPLVGEVVGGDDGECVGDLGLDGGRGGEEEGGEEGLD